MFALLEKLDGKAVELGTSLETYIHVSGLDGRKQYIVHLLLNFPLVACLYVWILLSDDLVQLGTTSMPKETAIFAFAGVSICHGLMMVPSLFGTNPFYLPIIYLRLLPAILLKWQALELASLIVGACSDDDNSPLGIRCEEKGLLCLYVLISILLTTVMVYVGYNFVGIRVWYIGCAFMLMIPIHSVLNHRVDKIAATVPFIDFVLSWAIESLTVPDLIKDYEFGELMQEYRRCNDPETKTHLREYIETTEARNEKRLLLKYRLWADEVSIVFTIITITIYVAVNMYPLGTVCGVLCHVLSEDGSYISPLFYTFAASMCFVKFTALSCKGLLRCLQLSPQEQCNKWDFPLMFYTWFLFLESGIVWNNSDHIPTSESAIFIFLVIIFCERMLHCIQVQIIEKQSQTFYANLYKYHIAVFAFLCFVPVAIIVYMALELNVGILQLFLATGTSVVCLRALVVGSHLLAETLHQSYSLTEHRKDLIKTRAYQMYEPAIYLLVVLGIYSAMSISCFSVNESLRIGLNMFVVLTTFIPLADMRPVNVHALPVEEQVFYYS